MDRLKKIDIKSKLLLVVITGVLFVFLYREFNAIPFSLGLMIRKCIIMFGLYVFVAIHFFVDIKKMYDFIFKYRWLIGIAIFVFLVINKYHFSSVSCFDAYIQPGMGSVYVHPIFGEARAIRSDEWLVNLPRALTGVYTNFSQYNDIVSGTSTTNISASGLFLNYSALAKPVDWGYYLFGIEYGLAWHWGFKMVFGFLFVFELFYIVTRNDRMFSLFGAALTWFSTYNMWWSTVTWLWTGCAAIVLFYYFIKEEKTKKRWLWGIGIAIFGTSFTVELYPAWLVPAGFVFLSLLIWVFLSQKEDWKKFRLVDWGIGVCCILIMASIVLVYLINFREYMDAITNTVYPGERVSFGGYSLDKMLGYFSSVLTGYFPSVNPCEPACFMVVYPLAYIVGVIALIKTKGKNLLLWMLFVPLMLLSAYCYMELPEVFARITLLTYSTPFRAVDVLGFLLAIILVVSLTEIKKSNGIKLYFSVPIVLFCISLAIKYSWAREESRKIKLLVLLIAVAVMIIEILVLSCKQEKARRVALSMACIFLIVTGMSIHPLNHGLDAIMSKPVAGVIKDIVEQDEDAKWIATNSIVNGNYLIACGASTYNSINYIPNMELWDKLDPSKKYDEVYNRYAHVEVRLVDDVTSMELIGVDYFALNLSYDDIKTIGIDYIFSVCPLESKEKIDFELVYEEAGVYIYSCN